MTWGGGREIWGDLRKYGVTLGGRFGVTPGRRFGVTWGGEIWGDPRKGGVTLGEGRFGVLGEDLGCPKSYGGWDPQH